MPNQPRPDNPARAVRIEDGLWHAAKRAAAERGETVSDVIRRSLERYIRAGRTARGDRTRGVTWAASGPGHRVNGNPGPEPS